MCVAIYKPGKKHFSREVAQACFAANPDGAGFVVWCMGEDTKPYLACFKGYFKFESFWEAWERNGGDAYTALIHFRIATHGKVNKANCHPHMMGRNKLALVHNGVIGCATPFSSNERSDTRVFADTIIEPIFNSRPDFIKDDGYGLILERMVGSGNRIAMMRDDGQVMILNERGGDWHEGIWYSNKTWYWKMNVEKRRGQHGQEPLEPMVTRIGADWESGDEGEEIWSFAYNQGLSDASNGRDTIHPASVKDDDWNVAYMAGYRAVVKRVWEQDDFKAGHACYDNGGHPGPDATNVFCVGFWWGKHLATLAKTFNVTKAIQ